MGNNWTISKELCFEHNCLRPILDWGQASTIYTAAVVKKFPKATPELLSYQLTIIKAAQQYDGLQWRAYNTHFSINATATGNRCWSRLDTDLYTRFFTRHAKVMTPCSLCDTHVTRLLKEADEEGRGQRDGRSFPAKRRQCTEFITRGTCTFKDRCKYRHACGECGADHAVKICPSLTTSPRKWWPISLEPTMNKIYAAVLARRLASWAIRNKTISTSQKGFLPYEGCTEHSFVLRSVVKESKRRQKNARVVWLDLQNAFGSVPHSTMWEMMNHLHVHPDFITICKEIYNRSSQVVKNSTGQTSPIPVARGIKQSCPLSPLLFNLVLEGIVPELNKYTGYQFKGRARVRCLAYADNLCPLSRQKDEISAMLKDVNTFFDYD